MICNVYMTQQRRKYSEMMACAKSCLMHIFFSLNGNNKIILYIYDKRLCDYDHISSSYIIHVVVASKYIVHTAYAGGSMQPKIDKMANASNAAQRKATFSSSCEEVSSSKSKFAGELEQQVDVLLLDQDMCQSQISVCR